MSVVNGIFPTGNLIAKMVIKSIIDSPIKDYDIVLLLTFGMVGTKVFWHYSTDGRFLDRESNEANHLPMIIDGYTVLPTIRPYEYCKNNIQYVNPYSIHESIIDNLKNHFSNQYQLSVCKNSSKNSMDFAFSYYLIKTCVETHQGENDELYNCDGNADATI